MATPTENIRLVGILEKVAVGALCLIVTWQYNSINRLEERVFNMQGEMFTEAKAKVLEERITQNMDARFSNMDSKLGLILNYVSDRRSK
jgi:predicted Holliday junction resolvase-like endonuclease